MYYLVYLTYTWETGVQLSTEDLGWLRHAIVKGIRSK